MSLVNKSKEKFVWPDVIMERDEEKIIDLTSAKNQKYLSEKKATPVKDQTQMRPLRIKSIINP
jgi:hypothetical protein